MLRFQLERWRPGLQRLGAVAVVATVALIIVRVTTRQGERPEKLDTVRNDGKPARTEPPPKPSRELLRQAGTLVTEKLPFEILPPVDGSYPRDLEDPTAFGAALAGHGRFAAVGAWGDDRHGHDRGAIYVFAFEGGRWIRRSHTLFPDADAPRNERRPQRRFGRQVTMHDGAIAVMESDLVNRPDEDDPVAVHVFESDDGWRTSRCAAVLPTPPDGRGHGISMAFADPRTLLVAAPAPKPELNGDREGDVFIYERFGDSTDGPKWKQTGRLGPPPELSPLKFGWGLAAEGDFAAVGALRSDRDPVTARGGVAIYRREPASPAGGPPAVDGDRTRFRWALTAVFDAGDATSRFFGAALALRGERLLVQQSTDLWNDEDPPARLHPSIFVFRRTSPDGRQWASEGRLTPAEVRADPNCWTRELFAWGDHVALSEDGRWAAAGALDASRLGDPSKDGTGIGAVDLFHRHDENGVSTWQPHSRLVAADAHEGAGFGTHVAITASQVLIGAPSFITAADGNLGAVYVWRLPGNDEAETD